MSPLRSLLTLGIALLLASGACVYVASREARRERPWPFGDEGAPCPMGSDNPGTGWSARDLGDVDGDGVPDCAIGSWFDPVTDEAAYTTWIVSGASGAPLYSIRTIPPAALDPRDEQVSMRSWHAVLPLPEHDDGREKELCVRLAVTSMQGHAIPVAVVSGRDGVETSRLARLPDELQNAANVVGDYDADGANDFVARDGLGVLQIHASRDRQVIRDVPDLIDGFLVGDIDADGTVDIAGPTSWHGPTIRVLSGKSLSTLHEFHVVPPAQYVYVCSAAGDVDMDGFGDLFVVSDSQLDCANRRWVPAFGIVTLYSGRDGRVLRQIDRATLQEYERSGVLRRVIGWDS